MQEIPYPRHPALLGACITAGVWSYPHWLPPPGQLSAAIAALCSLGMLCALAACQPEPAMPPVELCMLMLVSESKVSSAVSLAALVSRAISRCKPRLHTARAFDGESVPMIASSAPLCSSGTCRHLSRGRPAVRVR